MPRQVRTNNLQLAILFFTKCLDTEDSKDVSRSSSISAADRSGQGKRGKPAKQRRDDSEGFDVRSQYTPFFPPQQQPTWAPMPQYTTNNVPQFGNTMQTAYQNTHPFGQQQQFHPSMMPNNNVPPYGQMHPNLIPQVSILYNTYFLTNINAY
jgi:hypothetical protein